MAHGLIGYTGFVGGTLARQHRFDARYNSQNIATLAGQQFELLICAGAPAEKWKANQDPDQDEANLDRLTDALRRCRADRLVLISTVDVYPDPRQVNEDSKIDRTRLAPYGLHRLQLEEFAELHFSRVHVLRLPALFGRGLKKNYIYDLLHDNCLDWTDERSRFQFYDMSRLWSDINTAIEQDLPLVSLATEPVTAGEIAQHCFGIDFHNQTEKPPADYDMRSRYAKLFGGYQKGDHGGYLYDREESLARIARFVETERQQQLKHV